jgi:hypothetical protein
MFGWLRQMLSRLGQTGRAAGGAAAYQRLRSQGLSVQRSAAGIPAPHPDAPVWGLLMEMGFPNGTATLIALADGTTSLYYSGGGGVLGGHGHESVRRATAPMLAEANRLVAQMTPTSTYPLPQAGNTIFYARTDSGVLTGSAPDADLGLGRHALSPLFHAGHGILTELRLASSGPEPER